MMGALKTAAVLLSALCQDLTVDALKASWVGFSKASFTEGQLETCAYFVCVGFGGTYVLL